MSDFVYESRRPVRIIPSTAEKTTVVYNRDKDGCFNKSELKNALKDLGAFFPGWRADRAFGKVDANNDGEISGEEIDSLLQYLSSCGF